MKKRIKNSLINKSIRISYIKTELKQLVKKVFLFNKSPNIYQKIANYCEGGDVIGARAARSNQRLYCAITNSPKIVTRKYKLGRFVLSKLANTGGIPGVYKRG